jgi:hypothetical protein
MAIGATDFTLGNWSNAVWASSPTPVTVSGNVTVTVSSTTVTAASTDVATPYYLFFISPSGSDVNWTALLCWLPLLVALYRRYMG